jgi:DNA ligase-1
MKTLMHFRDFVNEITTSASRKHKQDVLAKYKDDEVVKQYLKIAYDPYTVFGISTKKLNKKVAGMNAYPCEVFELFEYLTSDNTGSDADIKVCQATLEDVFSKDIECSHLLEELICKDLSIGCDAKTINSIIPDLIPTFNVMLAEKFFDKPERVEGKEFALTTKIDGGRIIAIKENGSVSFFTRAGQKYEGLVDLENELKEILDDNFVLDGEITLLDPKGLSSKDQYKETMKITRKDGEKHGVKMLVFDYMPVANFKIQNCPISYSARRAYLSSMFDLCALKYFELLPLLYVGSDVSVIPKCLDEAITDGQEGIMINICDAPYEFKRTWNLLKVKKMNTMDLQIIGFEEGTGRLAGTLGAILVRYKNGNTVKVGSGFTDWLRTEIWNNQGKYLDQIVEIKYFEETTNQDGGESLRFPIFNDFRPDKLEADY